MSQSTQSALCDVNPKRIMRTIISMMSELGSFSAALILQETVSLLSHEQEAVELAEIVGDDFPLYGEVVGTGLSYSDMKTCVEERTDILIKELRGFSTIVVVGMESVILDRLLQHLPESQIYIVPHNQHIDSERVLANFPSNVRLIDIRELMDLGGVRSVLLSYVFCRMEEESFVYPVTFRALGSDVKSSYSQIIGLNLLSGYSRYLGDMAPLYSTNEFFTSEFRIL